MRKKPHISLTKLTLGRLAAFCVSALILITGCDSTRMMESTDPDRSIMMKFNGQTNTQIPFKYAVTTNIREHS